jgi:hypothetical protein
MGAIAAVGDANMNAIATPERPQPTFSPDQFVDTATAAQLLGLSAIYLRQMRVNGGGPPFARLSAKAVRYRVRDLLRWAESKIVGSTAEK